MNPNVSTRLIEKNNDGHQVPAGWKSDPMWIVAGVPITDVYKGMVRVILDPFKVSETGYYVVTVSGKAASAVVPSAPSDPHRKPEPDMVPTKPTTRIDIL